MISVNGRTDLLAYSFRCRVEFRTLGDSSTGHVGTEEVYHASLSPAEYATRLEDCGLHLTAFVAEDPGCEKHTVLMARKND